MDVDAASIGDALRSCCTISFQATQRVPDIGILTQKETTHATSDSQRAGIAWVWCEICVCNLGNFAFYQRTCHSPTGLIMDNNSTTMNILTCTDSSICPAPAAAPWCRLVSQWRPWVRCPC